MASVKLNPAIQFYASPAEFGDWVREWVESFNLHYLFARLFSRYDRPKFTVCQSVAWDDRSAVTEVIRDFSCLYLSVVPLNADVDSINRLPTANRDQVHINLPRFSENGLEAASFGSVSLVKASMKVYQAVARDLLARTEEGTWFRQWDRKKLTLDRVFRYGPGASLLLEQGVPIVGGGRIVVGRFGTGRVSRLRD